VNEGVDRSIFIDWYTKKQSKEGTHKYSRTAESCQLTLVARKLRSRPFMEEIFNFCQLAALGLMPVWQDVLQALANGAANVMYTEGQFYTTQVSVRCIE
jgi:hypothetical protein